jgi:hypothetical protein
MSFGEKYMKAKYYQRRKDYYNAHKVEINASRRKKYSVLPAEKKGKLNEQSRTYNLKKKYGLTPNQFEQMFIDQAGRCGICNENMVKGQLTHVDHDHVTGRVRGLLCNLCNTKLGWYEDNKDAIINYLSSN